MSERIRQQYSGFLQTHQLLPSNTINNISSFEIDEEARESQLITIPEKLVLGKRIERFFSHYIEYSDQYKLLTENIQIQEGKRTIGELDFLIYDEIEKSAIHIELVYKFYLYVNDNEEQELNCWVGPNRNDSLVQKLEKLQTKQFPLLSNTYTVKELGKLNLNLEEIEQRLCFLGQLFLPFNERNSSIQAVNKNCVVGWWITKGEFLNVYQTFDSFFIPDKQDWVIDPETNKKWIPFVEFRKELEELHLNEKSPLCWFKDKNGTTEKGFIVWW